MSTFGSLLSGGIPDRRKNFAEWERWKAEHPEEYEADLRARADAHAKQLKVKREAEKRRQAKLTPAQKKAEKRAAMWRDIDAIDKRAEQETREEHAAARAEKKRREEEGEE